MIFLLALVLLMQPKTEAQAASAGTIMSKGLTQYSKGNYKKARTYFKKLSKYASESCVKNMSSAMKKAYLKKVKSYRIELSIWSSSAYLWDYYLTDIDNDKQAELLIEYGTCEADVKLIVFKYSNGKLKRLGSVYCSHMTFSAYPGHNGIIGVSAHMNVERVVRIYVKNGKLKSELIGYREECTSYINVRQYLKSHIKYDSNYNRSLITSDLT